MKDFLDKRIMDRIIQIDVDLLKALKKMDDIQAKSLLVFDGNNFINILSVGDIQRAIIKNKPFSTPLGDIMRKDTMLAFSRDPEEAIKKKMLKYRTECMPVLNHKKELIQVYFWEDIFLSDDQAYEPFDLPVVIMAGGIGSRMKPITNILPKPLIPLGDKTILELIMDRFVKFGSNRFYLSVNYKADMIKYYFDTLDHPDYEIQYFQEPRPLGTVGSLYLLKNEIKTTFFISNCDILIDTDYNEILEFHREQENEITLVAALKHYEIPYGTLETKEKGRLCQLNEKPEMTFKINSGLYILEPELIDEIPRGSFFHITQLIEKVMSREGNVGVFPVSQGSWKDIGKWDEYLSVIHDF